MNWGDLDGSWHGREVVVTDPTLGRPPEWPPTVGTLVQEQPDHVPVLRDGSMLHSFADWAQVDLMTERPCSNRVEGFYRCARPARHRGACAFELPDL